MSVDLVQGELVMDAETLTRWGEGIRTEDIALTIVRPEMMIEGLTGLGGPASQLVTHNSKLITQNSQSDLDSLFLAHHAGQSGSEMGGAPGAPNMPEDPGDGERYAMVPVRGFEVGDNSVATGKAPSKQATPPQPGGVGTKTGEAKVSNPGSGWLNFGKSLGRKAVDMGREIGTSLQQAHNDAIAAKVLEKIGADQTPELKDKLSKAIGQLNVLDQTQLLLLLRDANLDLLSFAVRVSLLSRLYDEKVSAEMLANYIRTIPSRMKAARIAANSGDMIEEERGWLAIDGLTSDEWNRLWKVIQKNPTYEGYQGSAQINDFDTKKLREHYSPPPPAPPPKQVAKAPPKSPPPPPLPLPSMQIDKVPPWPSMQLDPQGPPWPSMQLSPEAELRSAAEAFERDLPKHIDEAAAELAKSHKATEARRNQILQEAKDEAAKRAALIEELENRIDKRRAYYPWYVGGSLIGPLVTTPSKDTKWNPETDKDFAGLAKDLENARDAKNFTVVPDKGGYRTNIGMLDVKEITPEGREKREEDAKWLKRLEEIDKMSAFEKLKHVLQLTADPWKIGDELRAEIGELLSPGNIAKMATFATGAAILSVTPLAPVVYGFGYFMLGEAVYEVGKELATFLVFSLGAKTDADFEKAAASGREMIKKAVRKSAQAAMGAGGIALRKMGSRVQKGPKNAPNFFTSQTTWNASGKGTGKTYKVFRQDIDWNLKAFGKTNAQWAREGKAPYIMKNGKAEQVQLHHSRQDARGPLFELSESTHIRTKKGAGREALHPHGQKKHPDHPVDRKAFDVDREQYWKDRVKEAGR